MKHIITIGREHGSGGREIGRKLAEALNIPFYDNELVNRICKEKGLPQKFFSEYDERKGSLLYSLIMDLYAKDTNLSGNISLEQKLFNIQSDVINSIADEGSCVIIGRCADYILKDRKNVISVFISADTDSKIKRVSTRNGINEQDAKTKMKDTDNKRRNYYNYYTNKKWGYSYCYDFCIKSNRLGIEQTVFTLKNMVDFLGRG